MDQKNLSSFPSDLGSRRAAVYFRVSTAAKCKHGDTTDFVQNPEVQEQPLLDLIAQRGWVLYQVYSDRPSGATQRRPALAALMADARRRRFDSVVVWRFDRFARSVSELVLALEEFQTLGIDFVSHQEAIDTGTPMGKTMFTVIAAMAELERSIIRERVLAGLEHAKQNGTRTGRPIGRPRAIVDRERVLYLRDVEKRPWPEVARMVRSTNGTVRRVYAKAKEAAPAGEDLRRRAYE